MTWYVSWLFRFTAEIIAGNEFVPEKAKSRKITSITKSHFRALLCTSFVYITLHMCTLRTEHIYSLMYIYTIPITIYLYVHSIIRIILVVSLMGVLSVCRDNYRPRCHQDCCWLNIARPLLSRENPRRFLPSWWRRPEMVSCRFHLP